MRNIFELTKSEQRIVILIVTLLAAIALAKHAWQKTSPAKPNISPLEATASH